MTAACPDTVSICKSLFVLDLQFLTADSRIVYMVRDLFYVHENSLGSDVDGALLAGDCLKTLFRELLDVMQDCEEGIRRNTDPDYLHDFRVATRKSRTLLLMVKGVFPKKSVDRYGKGLAWLFRATTPIRDLHVYLEKLPGYIQHLPVAKAAQLGHFSDFLQKRMLQEHRSLLGVLESKRYRNLMRSWQSFIDEPVVNTSRMPDVRRPVKEVADKALQRAYHKLLKCGERLHRNGEASALHRFRIRCKKFRYLLVLFKPLYQEKNINPVTRLLKHVQEALGDYHDLQIEIDILRSYELQAGNRDTLPETAIGANKALMHYLTKQQQAKHKQFQKIYKELNSRQSRTHIKTMLEI